MQTVENNPLDDFLSYFLHSRESGLLIAEGRLQLAKAHSTLAGAGLLFSKSWRSTLRQLALDIPVAVLVTAPLDKELFQILQQYQSRSGMIQIMDPQSLEMVTVHCNPLHARLLLVAEAEELVKIEQDYAIRSSVGLIEII